MYQLSFSLEEFLSEYWQKKPTIIKGGFKNFQDPLTPDELAGLAMEEEIDSRFVSNLDDKWDAKHGPFDESLFHDLPETNWSIIVQAVNHWHPIAAKLVSPFRMLPNWLIDDLMVSYSVPDGGVGPHIDQYDVFITQGVGKRHWRVGAKDEGQYEETCRHSVLRQITGFEPIIDEILEPGDILYIPPGFPHDGYALEPSMSYSVGFRSPKEQELLSGFADFVIANDQGDVHYHNPDMKAQPNAGAIQPSDLTMLSDMLSKALENKANIKDFMGEYLSQSRHELDMIAAEPPWQNSEVYDFLASGETLSRLGGLRAFYHPDQPHIVYINGEKYQLPLELAPVAKALCDNEFINQELLDTQMDDPAFIAMLTQLANQGLWFPADE